MTKVMPITMTMQASPLLDWLDCRLFEISSSIYYRDDDDDDDDDGDDRNRITAPRPNYRGGVAIAANREAQSNCRCRRGIAGFDSRDDAALRNIDSPPSE